MNPLPNPEGLEAFAKRGSARRFSPQPVPEELLASCLASAQRAATSHLIQAYLLLRVRDVRTRAALAELAGNQPQVQEAAAFYVVCGDQRRVRLACDAQATPCVLNFETFLLCTLDTCIFAQAFASACESQGLAIGYIGGLRQDLFGLDRLLELPPDVFPYFGLCVGHAAEAPVRWPRLAAAEILHEERVAALETTRAAIADYDRSLNAVHAARGKPKHDWSGQIRRLFAHPQRPEVARYYRSKGAVLE